MPIVGVPVNASHNFKTLARRLKKMSEYEEWPEIVTEWKLERVFLERDGTCLCTHHPITEHCVLRNHLNGNRATVGNCCVNHFMGLDTGNLFDGLRRIREDVQAAMNPDAFNYARRQGWLNAWELDFYRDTWRKRSLSPRQFDKRVQINRMVLEHVVHGR